MSNGIIGKVYLTLSDYEFLEEKPPTGIEKIKIYVDKLRESLT